MSEIREIAERLMNEHDHTFRRLRIDEIRGRINNDGGYAEMDPGTASEWRMNAKTILAAYDALRTELEEDDKISRRAAAEHFCITYAMLRVYERAIPSLLCLSSGKNRTTNYDRAAMRVMLKAIQAHKGLGIPFKLLERYLRGELVPSELSK